MNGRPREMGICISWHRTTGWIKPDRGGADVHVHFKNIESNDAYRELAVGVRVTFERGTDPNGRETAVAVQAA